jgi:hypothetical protein
LARTIAYDRMGKEPLSTISTSSGISSSPMPGSWMLVRPWCESEESARVSASTLSSLVGLGICGATNDIAVSVKTPVGSPVV